MSRARDRAGALSPAGLHLQRLQDHCAGDRREGVRRTAGRAAA
jgi:hypothetical protein